MTKHEQIIKYIESLKIGQKISVRQIAKEMEVSEGTAYRAIKEAENIGIVSTKERIGTIRIEKPQRFLDQLTFHEVVDIVDGKVLGGAGGLDKTLNKFVIGAMKLENMLEYIHPGSLLLVGNRENAQMKALEQGAGVLVTGGFDISLEARELADQTEMPVISSKYDTFTIASMINRAMYDRIIKKKIMLVEDVMPPRESIQVLKTGHTVQDYWNASQSAGYERFPVIDDWGRVVGVITAKDVTSSAPEQSVEKLMTRNPLTVTSTTSIASAAHLMVWEGIDLVPVVDHHRKLLSVISRPEVLKALQMSHNQPHLGETYENEIWSSFQESRDAEGALEFIGMMTPQMTSQLGTVSEGVLTLCITKAAYHSIKDQKQGDLVFDNISLYFLRPLQIESQIVIKPRIIELSRKFGKVEVEIANQGQMAAKALLTAHVIEQGW
ncbi:DRTGG domain-containing protein [Marinicrinis lubricantis]|uniref:DRTGG domain-containing protein n=1 Tax=Marinicrinis lubricantis TaxID=2086470 RepID=A0ABW1IH71_9BACL